jgi:hypothetical protein
MILSLGVFSFRGFGKEEKPQNIDDIEILSEKIDQVLKNQQDIIQRLKDIRAQQDIIRVRASRN